MAKKINVFFDETQNRLIITEDNVQKDDYIDLNSLSNFESFIKNKAFNQYKQEIIQSSQEIQILKNNNEELNQALNNSQHNFELLQTQKNNLEQSQKQLLQNAKYEAINEYKQSNVEYLKLVENAKKLQESNLELKAQLDVKNQELENIRKQAINEYKVSPEFVNLQNQINSLNAKNQELNLKLNSQQELQQQAIRTAELQSIERYKQSDDYKKLVQSQIDLAKAEADKNNELLNQKMLFDQELNKNKNGYEFQIQQLKEKLDQITLARTANNTKLLGERLEVECWENYNNSMGQFVSDVSFERATKEINGRKPDFIFKVYAHSLEDISIKDNPILATAVLEMKTESLLSQDANKKKNKDHLEKLEKDRINNNADFAILVTELESNDEFVMKRDPSYPKIIMVRPIAMVPVLSLIRTIGLKNRDVQLKAIEFKNQQDIINEFEEFKSSILDNALKNINANLETIIKAATSIETSARKIQDEANKALNKHTKTIENKILNYRIENKIIKKINALEVIKDTPSLTSGAHTELNDEDILKEQVKIKN